jgi:hypothetical protein
MKNIVLSLVVSSVLLLLVVGCEDNSINNPISVESFNKAEPNSGITLHGSIILDHRLEVPGTIKKYYLLSGTIRYSQELIINNFPAKEPGHNVLLDISIEALLKDVSASNGEQNTWKILAESKELTFVALNGSTILVKSYPVLGRTDEMELVCTFAITTQGLKLESVVLSSPVV